MDSFEEQSPPRKRGGDCSNGEINNEQAWDDFEYVNHEFLSTITQRSEESDNILRNHVKLLWKLRESQEILNRP